MSVLEGIKTLDNMGYTERQGHGFAYEQRTLERFSLTKCKNYTSEFDATCGHIQVQVKCIKQGGAIELGCYNRNKNKKHSFILIIGFWRGSKDNIVEECIYFIDCNEYTMNLKYDKDAEMIAEMKLISNLKEDDVRWRDFCAKHKTSWKEQNNHIDIRFKRDHKTQKRIQCAISWKNYNTWFKETFKMLTLEKFESLISDINNGNVTHEQNDTTRSRTKQEHN